MGTPTHRAIFVPLPIGRIVYPTHTTFSTLAPEPQDLHTKTQNKTWRTGKDLEDMLWTQRERREGGEVIVESAQIGWVVARLRAIEGPRISWEK